MAVSVVVPCPPTCETPEDAEFGYSLDDHGLTIHWPGYPLLSSGILVGIAHHHLGVEGVCPAPRR